MSGGERIALLRGELKRQDWDGFLVPRTDEYQGEYVPASAERLQWLTGFGGSAGMAIVLEPTAAIFVDGRYTLQVRDQVDTSIFTPRHITEEPASVWLKEQLEPGAKIAFDPWLHTPAQVSRMRKAVEAAGGQLVAADSNPIDAVWSDRPAPPTTRAKAHQLEYAGEASQDKRAVIAAKLQARGIDAAFLSSPDSIAWLLNVRGGDVPHVPLVLSFALLHAGGEVDWFVDPLKLPNDDSLGLDGRVSISSPDALASALDGLSEKRILIDEDSAPEWVRARLLAAGAKLVLGADPCLLPKARKNETEVSGARAAHRRDGLALTRFLCWLDGQVEAGATLTELALVERLLSFRKEMPLFRDLSFDTIAGSGSNGAIVHYRVDEESNRTLQKGELFLLDSGGQYLDGTTDVTRTIAIGEPDEEMRRAFTLVLKGHIAVARTRFPKGTTGSQLDSLARYPLWLEGMDFDHGTGHGVGSYLSVHEGPQRISKVPNAVALEPGMIVSNEPGYYKTGAYGIRIENLVTVIEDSSESPDGRILRAFETLTLAPLDRRLVIAEMLSHDERDWLNSYHASVREAHKDALQDKECDWLMRVTAPL